MRQDEGVRSLGLKAFANWRTRLTRFRGCFIRSFPALESLNNGGFNDHFEDGVASSWAHSRGSREPQLRARAERRADLIQSSAPRAATKHGANRSASGPPNNAGSRG